MPTPFANHQSLLKALNGRVPVTRFAPSPTGYLHLGHVVNALYVWGIARGLGGKVILRMEDHDRHRCKPEYEIAILEDLAWLGLEPDLGFPLNAQASPSDFRQSDQQELYAATWQRLWEQQQVYICDCSRRIIRERTGQGRGEVCYDGFCREKELAPEKDRNWRLQLPSHSVEFNDLRLGQQSQTPAQQCGDMLLRDRKGN